MSSRYAFNPYGHRPPDSLLETPSADTQIWRYIPVERFVSLLETRKLFLCRASRFEDAFEGATPRLSENRLMAYEARTTSPENRALYRTNRAMARDIVAVNCWHIAEHESVSMWDRYMVRGQGVAIRSTVRRLGAAFPQRANNGITCSEDIDIARVRYIDYETGHFPLWNVNYHFVHKRLEYASECELRVFTTITEEATAESARGGTDYAITKEGLLVPVDIDTLIETIYIAPQAPPDVTKTVQDAWERQGLGRNAVRPSKLSARPIY